MALVRSGNWTKIREVGVASTQKIIGVLKQRGFIRVDPNSYSVSDY